MLNPFILVPSVAGKVHDWWTPPKQPEPPAAFERARLAVCRTAFNIIDGLDRIRHSCDGLDKSLKLFVSLAVGAQLIPSANIRLWAGVARELKRIDGVFSAVSVFGRYTASLDILSRTDAQSAAIKKKQPTLIFKDTGTLFLTVAKTCEFGRLLQTVGLLSTNVLVNLDTQHLGGLVASIGNHSVLGRMAFDAGFGGCKNFFLVFSSAYAIVYNATVVIDWKVDTRDIQRAALSIGADAGKIYLATAAFAVTTTWVLVAFLTAIFSLTKILMDSYKEAEDNKQPIYPAWLDPARVSKT